MSQKLTLKQEAFAQAYLKTGNASEAYRSAYNASKMKDEAVHVNACKLLKHAKVALRLDQLQKEVAERNGVTVDEIVEELRKIAFVDPGDYYEWGPDGVTVKSSKDLTPDQRAVVAEVVQTKTPGGGTIKIKLSDKQAALEKLGKHLGIFKDVREVTGKDGKPIQTETTHKLDKKSAELARSFME